MHEQSSAGVRFGVLSDIHFPPEEADQASTAAILEACIQRCNAERVDFVVQLGDLIDGRFSTFAPALKLLAGLRCEVVHVLGNHDFDVGEDLLADVANRLRMPANYYAFSRGGFRFLALDGNDISLHAHPEGSEGWQSARAMLTAAEADGRPDAQDYNGAIGPEQAAWLQGQLAQAEQAGERVVVFNHFPVWPISEFTLWNGAEIVDQLRRHPKVILYVNGHAHRAARDEAHGIVFVTAPALLKSDGPTPLTLITLSGDGIDVRFLSLHGDELWFQQEIPFMHREVLDSIAAMLPKGLKVELPPRIFIDMEGEIIDYEEGHFLTVRFPVKERYRNPVGHMQGGMIVAAIDNTLGPLSYLVASPSVTTQLNTSYIRPVTTEDTHIDVVAQVEEKTGRQLFLSAEVLNPAGKPVALSHASCKILDVEEIMGSDE